MHRLCLCLRKDFEKRIRPLISHVKKPVREYAEIHTGIGTKDLAFDYSNRPQFDRLLRDTRLMTSIHNVGDVLVRLGRLLHDQLRRCHANADALIRQSIEHILETETAARLCARESAALQVSSVS